MKYNLDHIDRLLEAYWNAESSLADEATLRDYFQSGSIHPDHEVYAGLFGHFTNSRSLTTDIDVETVLAGISEQSKPSIFSIFSIKRYSMGIAAAFTIGLSVITVMNVETTTQHNRLVLDEAAETAEAMRVTKEALALLSNKLDRSSTKVNNGFSKMKAASIIK